MSEELKPPERNLWLREDTPHQINFIEAAGKGPEIVAFRKGPDPEKRELVEALRAAYDHLEYCNYGDRYENECARQDGLPKRLDAILQKHEKGGGE